MPLASHLPALRRYARAATGDAAAGDAALRGAMPALMRAIGEAEPRRARLRLLAALIAALDAASVVPLHAGGTFAAALAALPRDARHALLLTTLEELPDAEAAALLGLDLQRLEEARAQARAALKPFRPARVLIIEDEPLAAEHMAGLVEELGHAVCGLASDEMGAWLAAQRTRPDLVLADLDLGPGGNGLDAARRIAAGAALPIVVVTARPELAEAEGLGAVVRKPWQDLALQAAIGRALRGRHA